MIRIFVILLLLTFNSLCFSQEIKVAFSGSSPSESKVIDSIGYTHSHASIKAASDYAAGFTQTLIKSGFLKAELLSSTRTTDSSFAHIYSLGNRIKNIHIYIGRNPQAKTLAFPTLKKDSVSIPFANSEAFINLALSLLEQKGYSMATMQLTQLRQDKNDLYAVMDIDLGSPRQVNEIVINGYDKFPEGHKKQIRRLYRNKIFNRDNLQKIHADFEKFRFVNQTKYPEILFKQDTTKVYVYLEKEKANRFDGFIGFSNDAEEGDSKVRFQGYLDLLLVNTLNIGEQFTLFWKSDGKDQKTFNAGIELPYIFKSPFGIKANLNIFKQDSTFQNTKTAISLGYFLDYNTRIYLGYEATESSDIQNTNNTTISDFKNSFVTSTFEYFGFKSDDFLFPDRTRLILRAGAGSRKSKFEKNGQALFEINASHNFYLNEKNIFNVKSQNFYLKSDKYILSELYRFGGINSIRGFNENSLQANLLTSILTEYRFVFSPGLYAHSIIDYGYFRDESRAVDNGNSGSLLGLGIGFGLLTKNGLFNIVYANGSADSQQIKLSNSVVHISFKARF